MTCVDLLDHFCPKSCWNEYLLSLKARLQGAKSIYFGSVLFAPEL